MEVLKEYRQKIDLLDDQIVSLLAERFEIVRAVGRVKARHGIPVVQTARVDEVKDRVGAMAAGKNLDPDFVRHLYQVMIDHAHELENNCGERTSA